MKYILPKRLGRLNYQIGIRKIAKHFKKYLGRHLIAPDHDGFWELHKLYFVKERNYDYILPAEILHIFFLHRSF